MTVGRNGHCPRRPPRFLYTKGCTDRTARRLLRFGYDGAGFQGWARQPGHSTVEGELRRGIARREIAPSTDEAALAVASRTDAGVSARANALVLESPLTTTSLLRALNGISPRIFFTAASEVGPEFRVRRALHRHYRYFEPSKNAGLARWRDAAARFSGEVDVRSFARGLTVGESHRRTIESVEVTETPTGLVIDVLAPSFVWGMVRKIVAALREVDAGRLSLSRLERALAGEERLTLPLAEPERLVLWEVDYGRPWTQWWTGPNAHQRRWWDSEQAGIETRRAVLEALATAGADPGGSASPRAPSARASAPR